MLRRNSTDSPIRYLSESKGASSLSADRLDKMRLHTNACHTLRYCISLQERGAGHL